MAGLERTEAVFSEKSQQLQTSAESAAAHRRRKDFTWADNRELLIGLQEHVEALGLEEKLGDVAARLESPYYTFQLLPVNWASESDRGVRALSGFVIAKQFIRYPQPARNKTDHYFQAVLLQHNDQDLDVDLNVIPLPSQIEIAIGEVKDGVSGRREGNHLYETIAQEGERADVAAGHLFEFTPSVTSRTVHERMPVKGRIFTRQRVVEVEEPYVVHHTGPYRLGSEPFFPGQEALYIKHLDERLAAFVAREHQPTP